MRQYQHIFCILCSNFSYITCGYLNSNKISFKSLGIEYLIFLIYPIHIKKKGHMRFGIGPRTVTRQT